MKKNICQSNIEIMLDEYKVNTYCKQYNYKYKMYQGDRIAIIETPTDSWQITADTVNIKGEIAQRLEVGHYNKSGNKKGKMQFHTQKHARDIDYVFNSIISTHISGKSTVDNVFNLKNMYKDLKILKHA